MTRNHALPADDLVIERAQLDLMTVAGAEYDRDRVYRYRLWRRWDPQHENVCFIMLNPSTATAARSDPTVSRCVNFAKRRGFGGIEIVNLFAYRSTDPTVLRHAADPIGPRNDEKILEAATRQCLVIAAWGNHGDLHDRATHIRAALLERNVQPYALALTRDGHPHHPRGLPDDLDPKPWTHERNPE